MNDLNTKNFGGATSKGKLLSVIIPTYNMENYIERCISSLVVEDKELMKRLDIIVVNDGSKDRSSELAHQFADKYPDSICVIDKQNGNYGSCINAALPMVQGKYVRILDADDSYYTENLAGYLKALDGCNADLVLTKFNTVDCDGNIIKAYLPLEEEFEGKTFAMKDIPEWSYIMMHNVAFRKELFDGLGYHQTEGISYTDWEFVFHPMSRVKTVYYYPKNIYRYLIGREGQTVSPMITINKLEDEEASLFSQLAIISELDKSNEAYGFMKNMVVRRIVHIYVLGISRMSPFDLNAYDAHLLAEYPEFYEASNKRKVRVGGVGPMMPIAKMWRKVRSKDKLKFFPKYLMFILVTKFKRNR